MSSKTNWPSTGIPASGLAEVMIASAWIVYRPGVSSTVPGPMFVLPGPKSSTVEVTSSSPATWNTDQSKSQVVVTTKWRSKMIEPEIVPPLAVLKPERSPSPRIELPFKRNADRFASPVVAWLGVAAKALMSND
mgnify:CR=1 FL=1